MRTLLTFILVGLSAVSFGATYPVAWVGPAYVESIRAAGTGDGVTSSLGNADLLFVVLKDDQGNPLVINPANCPISDKYTFVPTSYNNKENMMFSMLLAAAISGRKVSVSVSQGYCDYSHPTIYDVMMEF